MKITAFSLKLLTYLFIFWGEIMPVSRIFSDLTPEPETVISRELDENNDVVLRDVRR